MEMNYDVDGVRGSPAAASVKDVGGRGGGAGDRAKFGFTTEMKTMSRREDRRFSMPHNSLNIGKQPSKISGVDDDPSLPQDFAVKYLGKCDATGLWGIKHTRKPVDTMVSEGRNATKNGDVMLPYLKLVVSQDGVYIAGMPQNKNPAFEGGLFPIQTISYGVQDLVYTRVFAMITVQEPPNFKFGGDQSATSITGAAAVDQPHPFQCHAFVCDSRNTARQLTLALSSAFKVFAKSVKAQETQTRPDKFAIDLRRCEDSDKEEDDPERVPEDSEV